MALYLPPGITVDKFRGGYKAASDFTDLEDTETSDAQNCIYTVGADLEQRQGMAKLLNTSLSATITGHHYFEKLGGSPIHVVATSDGCLYKYNSATASKIRSGLTGNSQSFWSFVQVADPRSASDDILIASNGVDPIQAWNGSATTVNLSSFTSATQVPIAKYLVQHKRRIYAFNIEDGTDVDSPVRMDITGFGGDGAPDPHRFEDSLFVGGSDRSGELQGGAFLNDQLILYRKRDIWKFTPGGGVVLDTAQVFQAEKSVGLLAPRTLVDTGDFHIFLSEQGVFAYDGNNLTHLSPLVDDDILRGSNRTLLKDAVARYDSEKLQYHLYYPGSGSSRNDRALIYDVRLQSWQPPVTGRQASVVSEFTNGDEEEKLILADYSGFLYEDRVGTNDGVSTGFNGNPTSVMVNSLTDTSQDFDTDGDGLAGVIVRIIDGLGANQERVISSNDSNTLTIEQDWAVVPSVTSTYSVGAVDSHWRSKDYDFAGHDIVKLFRSMRIRVREEGNFNLTLNYIIDFKKLVKSTKKLISLLGSGLVWGTSLWGEAVWGKLDTITRKISFRNTPVQSLQGQHLAVRVENRRANETWRVTGFDIETKPIGKR